MFELERINEALIESSSHSTQAIIERPVHAENPILAMKAPFSDDAAPISSSNCDSISVQRRVALRQRTSISARAGCPSIDLIDIAPELTGSPTLCGSSATMIQPADFWN